MITVEKTIHGSRMLLDADDPGISHDLITTGHREGRCPEILKKIVEQGMTCFDIGANLGYYALIELKAGATVYAFEPVESNCRLMMKSARLNGYTKLTVQQIALGDKNFATGYLLPANNRASNLGRIARDGDVYSGEYGKEPVTPVRMRTLDSLCREMDLVPDLLRFDTEGYEIEIIRGAKETLEAMKPGSWIFGEFHPRIFLRDNNLARIPELVECINTIVRAGFKLRRSARRAQRDLEEVPLKDLGKVCCEKYLDHAPPHLFFWKEQ